jgi:transketolase
MSLGALDEKFRSFGWDVETVNGHDIDALTSALEKRSDGPRAIIMNTIKGKCVSFMENNAGFHGKACNCEETARALKELKEGL